MEKTGHEKSRDTVPLRVTVEAVTGADRCGDDWNRKENNGAPEKATCPEQPSPRTNNTALESSKELH